MKICFIGPASVIHTVRWVNAMEEKGHEVFLITMHSPTINNISQNVTIYNLKIPAPLGYYLNSIEAKNIINKINPDIVNVHYASGYGTLSRFINFEPTLLSVWGSDVFNFPYKSNWNMKNIKKNLKSATQIASTSYAMKEQVHNLIGKHSQIFLTPFGVDMNLFKPSEDKVKSDYITIGIVKKLEEIYGVRYLIEAVAQLISKFNREGKQNIADKIKLKIIGEGSQEEELRELTYKLNIESITEFVGVVKHDQVPEYLNMLDIYCAPSIHESFGVAIIEASSCGVPVIVSNVEGLPEVVINEKTGFIVEKENAFQISEKLYELVLNEGKRKRFGEKGREFVKENYEWEYTVNKMEQTYEEVVSIYGARDRRYL